MARAFRYRLAGVLRLKEHAEDEALRHYLTTRSVRDARSRALTTLFQTRELAKERMGESEEGRVDVSELLRYQRYLGGLVLAIANAQKDLVKVERDLEAKRVILVDASKERKVLEKLKERRFDEWLHDYRREEQKVMDEIGNQRTIGKLEESA